MRIFQLIYFSSTQCINKNNQNYKFIKLFSMLTSTQARTPLPAPVNLSVTFLMVSLTFCLKFWMSFIIFSLTSFPCSWIPDANLVTASNACWAALRRFFISSSTSCLKRNLHILCYVEFMFDIFIVNQIKN